jgi:TPP-dependent pyruvate/acetoin dehydrogenase alpha subunit
MIEAKMMRMKGHAIHDAAEYVPKPLFEYWRKRDPILRLESYLLEKNWLTRAQNADLIAGVERELEADRDFAVNSPMPRPESAAGGVYCESGCHDLKPRYQVPNTAVTKSAPGTPKQREAAVHLK